MHNKEILFGAVAREKVLKGANILADAVKVTLGPCGRHVAFGREYAVPHVTKDGVTVAKQVKIKDASLDLGAQMLKEAAQKTADQAGDGTTTATVLAQAMINEGHKYVTAGANPMELKRGIELAVKHIVGNIAEDSRKISSNDQIKQVATISANGDQEIGAQIAQAIDKVGYDGVITVEEAKGLESSLEIVEGMQFERGYVSPYLVTHPDKQEAVLENPFVLITDKKLTTMKQLLPVLEVVARSQRPLFIVADDIEGEALATLVVNKMRGVLVVCAVKAPAFGDRRKAILEDLAILTGGTLISEDLGMSITNISMTDCGTAKKIVVTKDSTTIIEGAGNQEAIKSRVGQIKNQIETTLNDYDREKLQERLAKLAGGVAIIRVGAPTEVEMKEKKDRLDDALSATKAAIAEGVLPGGGAYLYKISTHLMEHLKDKSEGDSLLGVKLIIQAIQAPFRTICANAGVESASIVHELADKDKWIGYDARNGKVVDMLETGILDPAKVIRCALQNASSIASMVLTTECIMIEVSEEKKDEPINPATAGGMY